MNGVAISMPGVSLPAISPTANDGVNRVSGVNSVRIAVAAERLSRCAMSNNTTDVTCFYNLCISLARGIDYAIALNEIPDKASNLPKTCMLVCRKRLDYSLQAAIMVLMVAMKHACLSHWFSPEDTREVHALADEVARIFNTPEGLSSEQANLIPTVSEIMSRYYPQIKLGQILASIDIKPGFEACAASFHVSKSMRSASVGNIQLLVAMKDNIDTSACIINPQNVNFLLNGKGVPWRMAGYMETGPQLPTDVLQLLRYGTNLLQAIGYFEAHYVVLVAFMSSVPSSFLPVPDDYDQPTVESDAEVEEGASRISLNCPISFSRINKPAKGKLCKHLQCFDLSNYVEMNSRHPSWRCPNCNQPVCYPDLRIDKKMSKILQEVAKDVASVIFHSDGSWEAIPGSAEQKDDSPAKPSEGLQGVGPDQQVASGLPNEPRNVYDLTGGDEELVIMDVDVPEDTKPVLQSAERNPPEINRNLATQIQGLSSSGPVNGVSAPMLGRFTPSPVLTDSVSPAIRREQQTFQQTTNGLQLQHAQRPQTAPRYINRVPTANQGLPRQAPRPNPMMMSAGPVTNNLSGNNASSVPSNTPLLPPVSVNTSAPHRDSVQQPQLLQQSLAQMRSHNGPVQVHNNGFRATPGPQAANQLRPTGQIPPQMVSTPPHLRSRTQVPPGGSANRTPTINQHYRPMAASQQPAARTRQVHTAPIQIQTSRPLPASVPNGPTSVPGRMVQAVSRTQDLVGVQSAEQTWQPAGRMRGSLDGRAYSDALNEFMIRPTQQRTPAPAQTPASAPAPTANQGNMPPGLQAMLANQSVNGSSQQNPPQNNS